MSDEFKDTSIDIKPELTFEPFKEELQDMKITSFDNAINLLDDLPVCICETYSQDESRKIKSSLLYEILYILIHFLRLFINLFT